MVHIIELSLGNPVQVSKTLKANVIKDSVQLQQFVLKVNCSKSQ